MAKSPISIKVDVVGEDTIQQALERVGSAGAKILNKSLDRGSKFFLQKLEMNAPKLTGELSRGFTKIKEKHKSRKKAGQQVVLDRAKNNIFQRTNKNFDPTAKVDRKKLGLLRNKVGFSRKKQHFYYPSSIEYGYDHYYWGRHEEGKPAGGHRKGEYFVRQTLDRNYSTAEKIVSSVMYNELQKKWKAKVSKNGL